MEYVRLYTALLTHPKAEGLSDKAWRVLTLSWIYAGQHETEGKIPPQAKRFVRMSTATEAELTEHGWLHRNGDGWVLHDWEEHQVAAEDYRERHDRAKEANRLRQKEWRERQKKDGDNA